MPLFYTPKPRKFHYEPRFYDPEKEKWEALKQKYAMRNNGVHEESQNITNDENHASDDELSYFEEKVRRMDREEKQQRIGWRDLFRKREMPQFHYTPRFQQQEEGAHTLSPSNNATSGDTSATTASNGATEELTRKYSNDERGYRVRIRRRYNIEDSEYMKPVSAGKIMMYVLLACMLLYWILF